MYLIASRKAGNFLKKQISSLLKNIGNRIVKASPLRFSLLLLSSRDFISRSWRNCAMYISPFNSRTARRQLLRPAVRGEFRNSKRFWRKSSPRLWLMSTSSLLDHENWTTKEPSTRNYSTGKRYRWGGPIPTSSSLMGLQKRGPFQSHRMQMSVTYGRKRPNSTASVVVWTGMESLWVMAVSCVVTVFPVTRG